MRIVVNRKSNRFYPDSRRVIIRFYHHGLERSRGLAQRVMAMPNQEAEQALAQTLRNFAKRHRKLTDRFLAHYNQAREMLRENDLVLNGMSKAKKLLLGAYFSKEYSIESAAFFNPSIVESPDQSELEEGSKRVIVSFRATGEGHVSSIVFHSGIIHHNGELEFEQSRRYIDEPEIVKRHRYNKKSFVNKLREMNVDGEIIASVMESLPEKFIYGELVAAVEQAIENNHADRGRNRAIQEIIWLADSHYEVEFSRNTDLSERVIFPVSYAERKGIEDARFVKFTDDTGEVVYYGTYTAYDGNTILPKLILTRDFYHFQVKPLHGRGAQNKNLALFPRKINGQYVMLSRIDGVNSYIGFSDNINLWDEPIKIQEPKYPWEFVQVGNCGAPHETSAGWVVITHGVGPMRRYCLGASLLDLADPTREIGRLKEPLLIPNNEEREGYVPNVVYSCGSLIHNGELIVPYGLSDSGTGFLSVNLGQLLARLIED